jgi:hypothetical protein
MVLSLGLFLALSLCLNTIASIIIIISSPSPVQAWSLRPLLRLQPLLMVLSLGLFFALGLMPYVYLPLAASLWPRPGSWGDVTTLKGFIHHLRLASGVVVSWSFPSTGNDLVLHTPLYTRNDIGLYTYVGLMPYVYLPLAASLWPRPGSWGDVTTLKGFIHHLRFATAFAHSQ